MVTFKQLWENHPTITDDDAPCSTNGKPNFSDQCAIRMGVCLARCGVDTSQIPGVTHCWHHKKSEGHTIRAEELARGLARHSISGIQRVQNIPPAKFKKELRGKTGIIFFKDYWRRSGERHPSGDHIDLWNGSRLTDWSSWIRIQLHLVIPGVWSDFEKANAIMFWAII